MLSSPCKERAVDEVRSRGGEVRGVCSIVREGATCVRVDVACAAAVRGHVGLRDGLGLVFERGCIQTVPDVKVGEVLLLIRQVVRVVQQGEGESA